MIRGIFHFAIFGFLAALSAVDAQDVPTVDQSPNEAVEKAIQTFNERNAKKTNEVTVILPPPETESNPGQPIQAAENPAAAEKPPPVLVTGKPPQHTADTPTALKEEPNRKEEGLSIRVEKIQTGTGAIDPAQVELLAPFPPKPIGSPPPGWRLENPESIPPVQREINLSDNAKITLSIRPHILVPDANGSSSFRILEPGYDSALGYQQTATVGAVLQRSLRQMDEDSKQLGEVINQLEQLVASLPQPEVPPKATVIPNRKR
ncbi:MAG: hypothetical protein V4733_09915 [Verrucomicrobiota bacterium]